MNRRTVLASGSIALSSLCAGCLGETGSDTTDTADGDDDRSAVSVCEVSHTEPDPESDRHVAAWAHSDVPPYDASRPDDPEGFGEEAAEEWDETYLGRHMPNAPSLDFQVRDISSAAVRSRFGQSSGNDQYRLALIDTDTRREELLTSDQGTDFEESILVLAGQCCGSGSVTHRWKRVEATANGVHLHGYLERPYVQTADLTSRYSLLEIERPETTVEGACASLTVAPTKRVHFGAADGTVSLVSALVGNDTSDPVTATVRLVTGGGEVRVDETITIEPTEYWRGLGSVGTASERFTVEFVADGIDADRQTQYAGEDGPLGIRIQSGGDVAIGSSDDI